MPSLLDDLFLRLYSGIACSDASQAMETQERDIPCWGERMFSAGIEILCRWFAVGLARLVW